MSKHVETDTLKRCEAMTADEWYRKSRQCPNRREILVNSKQLCGRHAALEALALAFTNGDAKLLPQPAKRFDGVNIVKKEKR